MHDDIHIVLDSVSAALEMDIKNDPRCHVLRLLVSHDGQEWYDGDRSLEEMFALVESSGQLPKTSQPSMGEMLGLFAELSRQGKKLLVITLSSILSGTYQTACQAAKQVMKEVPGADIRVVDSKTAACPIVGIAMEILAKTAAGMGLDEAERLANDMVARTQTYFSVNTLEYLQKGGRIGAASALLGSIFGIRPIIRIAADGQLQPYDKCRTRKRVLKRMVESAAQHAPLEAIYVAHAVAEEDAKSMQRQMQELFPGVPTLMSGIGTVLAAHLGPGVIGLFVRQKA